MILRTPRAIGRAGVSPPGPGGGPHAAGVLGDKSGFRMRSQFAGTVVTFTAVGISMAHVDRALQILGSIIAVSVGVITIINTVKIWWRQHQKTQQELAELKALVKALPCVCPAAERKP